MSSSVSKQASDFRWNIGVDNPDGYAVTGFRVIMIPEPSSVSLLFASGLIVLNRRKKSVKTCQVENEIDGTGKTGVSAIVMG